MAAMVALALLPIEVSDAGWLQDIFKSSAKSSKSSAKPAVAPRPAASAKPVTRAKPAASPSPRVKLAALGPVTLPAAKPSTICDPSKFRIVLDVGHTAESEGAMSARNVTEFAFNLRLAQRIEEKLKADGFLETRLLVTGGKARPSLFKRVAAAEKLQAGLLLSIHHDSVPDALLESWEFEGKKSHFSDRFSGYSVFVSQDNPDYKTSLVFAELIGREMKAQGLQYADQYTKPIMGRNQHPLLNRETGVYSYNKLIVLKNSRMPAVLLEAGSIINRDEELKMNSPERQETISSGIATAAREFCDSRWAILGPL